jgi:hypothetical protein
LKQPTTGINLQPESEKRESMMDWQRRQLYRLRKGNKGIIMNLCLLVWQFTENWYFSLKPPTKKPPGPNGFPGEFCWPFREEVTHTLDILIQKGKREPHTPTNFVKLALEPKAKWLQKRESKEGRTEGKEKRTI